MHMPGPEIHHKSTEVNGLTIQQEKIVWKRESVLNPPWLTVYERTSNHQTWCSAACHSSSESTSCEWSQSCIPECRSSGWCSYETIQGESFVTHHAQISKSICVGELGAIMACMYLQARFQKSSVAVLVKLLPMACAGLQLQANLTMPQALQNSNSKSDVYRWPKMIKVLFSHQSHLTHSIEGNGKVLTNFTSGSICSAKSCGWLALSQAPQPGLLYFLQYTLLLLLCICA